MTDRGAIILRKEGELHSLIYVGFFQKYKLNTKRYVCTYLRTSFWAAGNFRYEQQNALPSTFDINYYICGVATFC
jgi:hypothetical protein